MSRAGYKPTRILITGATGFVGRHLIPALGHMCGDVELVPTSTRAATLHNGGRTESLDVTDRAAVFAAVERHRPTHIVHLAGVAATSKAASAPDVAWTIHVQGTLNVAGAILEKAPDCCLVNAGTGLVYGSSGESGLPLSETALLAPIDDYSVTKAAADLALGALAHRGLKCVRMRPFNHTGVGQTEAFAIPAWAMQVARIEAGLMHPTIRVGNLDAERDFVDVRDVAAAYALVVAKSTSIGSGRILNIASGKAHRLRDLLELLLSFSHVDIKIEQDPSRMRSSDLSCIVGDADEARQLIGWERKYELEQTLAEVLADCRNRISIAPSA